VAKRLGLALVLVAVPACSPSRPASPTFSEDVRPILVAHCTRCHGAGGMLQGDTASISGYQTPPVDGFFEDYQDQGDCTQADGGALPTPPACKHGAHAYATTYVSRWNGYVFPTRLMPPAPAAPLDDYELDVLNRWIENPVCGAGPVCAGDGGSVD
jgi:hypothetical protein